MTVPDLSQPRRSLGTAAARTLATTTKSVPQTQEITSRWLQRLLPWVQTSGGVYRVNRRLRHRVGGGRVGLVREGGGVRVVPPTLTELGPVHGYRDEAGLRVLAGLFAPRGYRRGEVIAQAGRRIDQVHVLVHGKAVRRGTGAHGGGTEHGVLAGGEHLGAPALADREARWEHTVTALTDCEVLALPLDALAGALGSVPSLADHLGAGRARPAVNAYGEAAIALSAGHSGEALLPGSFVDYDLAPREYELSAAQTVLRVSTRVADLYNEPMNQLDQQLRLTIEALRERQEWELFNNPEFGLLHDIAPGQRVHTRSGPPTPDDLDELLSRRKQTRVLLAHPRAMAAFGRECTRRGIYPGSAEVDGHTVPSWRSVPILPCLQLPVAADHSTSILALRIGEENGGVVGLHQTGVPDEYEPGLSVRFMGIDDRAVVSYLVTAYYSVAALVPDAVGVLENVELGHYGD